MTKAKTAAPKAPAAKPAAAAAPKTDAPKASPPGLDAFESQDEHRTHQMDVHVDGAFHEEFPADWQPPAQLEAPPPQQGMAQRWVRMSILGQNDATNIASQSGQGWRPRRLDTVPEGEQARYPSVRSARFGDVIVTGALILCEMPLGIYEQMEAHYKDKRISLKKSIQTDQALRSAVKAPQAGRGFGEVEAIERSTKVTTRRPISASD